MDKSKSLQRLLKMVLREKYPFVVDIEAKYTTKIYRSEEDIMTQDHKYDINVFVNRPILMTETRNIKNDIHDLKKMILTNPYHKIGDIYFSLRKNQ